VARSTYPCNHCDGIFLGSLYDKISPLEEAEAGWESISLDRLKLSLLQEKRNDVMPADPSMWALEKEFDTATLDGKLS